MYSKEELKEKLLSTNCFEDNEWLEKYVNIFFIFNTDYSRLESHHIFPKSNLEYCIKNNLIHEDLLNYFKNYTVNIPKVYHILSHLYLSRACRYPHMRDQNCCAVRIMLNDKSIKFSEINSVDDLKNLNIDEINYWSNERREAQANRFKDTMAKWRLEHPEEYNKQQAHHLCGERNGMYGKGYLLAGKPKSELHKKHLRENHADYKGSKNPFYNKHHSEETKAKLRSKNGHKVYIYDSSTFELLYKFDSIKQTAQELKIKDRRTIDRRLNKKDNSYFSEFLNKNIIFMLEVLND